MALGIHKIPEAAEGCTATKLQLVCSQRPVSPSAAGNSAVREKVAETLRDNEMHATHHCTRALPKVPTLHPESLQTCSDPAYWPR